MQNIARKSSFPILLLTVYLLFIFYITLFSRSFNFFRDCKLELFWSYLKWYRGDAILDVQILYNIVLFVPLGFFLFNVLQNCSVKGAGRFSVVASFILSVVIEAVQFFEKIGTCDVDDVFNNVLGACIGVSIYKLLVRCSTKEQLKWRKLTLSLLFLIGGVVGCYIAYISIKLLSK